MIATIPADGTPVDLGGLLNVGERRIRVQNEAGPTVYWARTREDCTPDTGIIFPANKEDDFRLGTSVFNALDRLWFCVDAGDDPGSLRVGILE